MYRELILWAHLWVLMGWNIYLWRWTTCQNGWKPHLFLTINGRVLPRSWKRTSSPDLAHLVPLLVIGDLIFATYCSKIYWRNIGLSIIWSLRTIHRLVGKIKQILSKMVNANRTDWSRRLDDAFLSYQTVFKNPIGMYPYQLVYGKACHLPVELEHRPYGRWRNWRWIW